MNPGDLAIVARRVLANEQGGQKILSEIANVEALFGEFHHVLETQGEQTLELQDRIISLGARVASFEGRLNVALAERESERARAQVERLCLERKRLTDTIDELRVRRDELKSEREDLNQATLEQARDIDQLEIALRAANDDADHCKQELQQISEAVAGLGYDSQCPRVAVKEIIDCYQSLSENAYRFYRPDGTFVVLDTPEEVVEKRIESAREIAAHRANAERLGGELTAAEAEIQTLKASIVKGWLGDEQASKLEHAFKAGWVARDETEITEVLAHVAADFRLRAFAAYGSNPLAERWNR